MPITVLCFQHSPWCSHPTPHTTPSWRTSTPSRTAGQSASDWSASFSATSRMPDTSTPLPSLYTCEGLAHFTPYGRLRIQWPVFEPAREHVHVLSLVCSDAVYPSGAHCPETGAVLLFHPIQRLYTTAGGPNAALLGELPVQVAPDGRVHAGTTYLRRSR